MNQKNDQQKHITNIINLIKQVLLVQRLSPKLSKVDKEKIKEDLNKLGKANFKWLDELVK